MKKMNRRLLAIGRPIRNYIAISTVASVLGALSHMGLMGFGALWLLAAAGFCDGMMTYAALTVTCAVSVSYTHLDVYKRQVDHCIRFCLSNYFFAGCGICDIHFFYIYANSFDALSCQFVHYVMSKLSFYTCYQNSHK